jgi:N-acetylglucosaminyl-diphospho-decaprenol L-rhamnosyltransferase
MLLILTINYRCSRLIEGLVENTLSTSDPDIHMIIVDNSPNDAGLKKLYCHPNITILSASSNLGFGAGCNLGLAYAEKKHPESIVWLLNPDARLLPGAKENVRRALGENNAYGVLGTRIQDLEGQIWFDRGRFDPWFGRLLHRPTAGAAEPCTETTLSEPSDWLSGCSLVLHLQRLIEPARFDPQIFLDYEDAELCLRLRQQGHPARVTKDILVEHAISSVTGRAPLAKYRHATFSKLYVLDKHATPLALLLNLIYYCLRPITYLHYDRTQARGRWAGLIDYLSWRWRQIKGDRRLMHPRTSFTDPSRGIASAEKSQY